MAELGSHSSSTAGDGDAWAIGQEFRCSVGSCNGWVVLTLAGELDMSHLGDVRRALLELPLTPGRRLAVDLRELSFMDSAGVRMILQAMAYADERRAGFAVIRGPDAVQRILEVVGLADQLSLVDDLGVRDEARG